MKTMLRRETYTRPGRPRIAWDRPARHAINRTNTGGQYTPARNL